MDKKWSQWILLRCISDKGWVDHELFLLSWRTFSCACCTLLSLLLLLDGHSTYTDLASLKFARDQGIIIFWLSPHTSVNLWCSLFKPLKEHWKQESHSFIAGTQDKLNFNGLFEMHGLIQLHLQMLLLDLEKLVSILSTKMQSPVLMFLFLKTKMRKARQYKY